MESLREDLLMSWIELSAVMRNERFMEKLSFNEAVVCSWIEKQRKACPAEPYLSIKELCAKTKMLKSQLNKTINDLEATGLVRRFRSEEDRRIVYVALREDHIHQYYEEHARILSFVQMIIDGIGERDAQEAIRIFGNITAVLDQKIYAKGAHKP